jgi:DUF4097 and DUF4098 domain-containing protein YvlB
MSEERQRVLRMLKEGKVTVEEAEALLEALDDTGPTGDARTAQSAEGAGGPAGAGPTGAEDGPTRGDARGSRGTGEPGGRGEFQRLIDEILSNVNVEGIKESVRESLRRSRADVDRVKDEVRRTTERVRDEMRRAAREHRHGFHVRLSRAIEGLWGLADSSGTWTHDAPLAPPRTLVLRNVWGDVRLTPSEDGTLHATARIRAWGRDAAEAEATRHAIAITTTDEGDAYVVTVHTPDWTMRRRFRADFEIRVPADVRVQVRQARGDVQATGLRGDIDVQTHSGDVSVRDLTGSVEAETSRGDVTAVQVTGDVRVHSRHGDLALTNIGGRVDGQLVHGDIHAHEVAGDVSCRTMHGDVRLDHVGGRVVADSKRGDVVLEHPTRPLALHLQTMSGDLAVDADEFVTGSTSVLHTVSGDITVRLGARTRCIVRTRVTSGDISVEGATDADRPTRRAVEAVVGAPDAVVEISAVSGDVTVSGAHASVAPASVLGR